jgi:hypothetical protein
MSTRVLLPSWVVPTADAVQECARVADRLAGVGPPWATKRDAGVASAFVWLTLGEVSPMTWRTCSTSEFGTVPGDGPSVAPVEMWTCGVTWEFARAESWVALCVAAGQGAPAAEDWRRLGVDARPAVTNDSEFAYGVWRTLAWLLGVREDFPIHTSWHRAAGIEPERPHLYSRTRAGPSDAAWRTAERAARDQAETDALRHWRHVRQRVDASATR